MQSLPQLTINQKISLKTFSINLANLYTMGLVQESTIMKIIIECLIECDYEIQRQISSGIFEEVQ